MGSTHPGRSLSRRRSARGPGSRRPRRSRLSAYVDSSALVGLLGGEPQRELVREALAALGPNASSRITYVEVRAALARALRGGRISSQGLERARDAFLVAWQGIEVIELDARIARLAAGVAETYALRSHDAIQLASALELQGGELALIALDERLRSAAREAGLAVAP